MRDSSGMSKGSGFVTFSKPEEASKAVSLLIHTCVHINNAEHYWKHYILMVKVFFFFRRFRLRRLMEK